MPTDRLERPTEIQHPVAATWIARDSGAQFALGIRKPPLSEHFARAVRMLFAFTWIGHGVVKSLLLKSRAC